MFRSLIAQIDALGDRIHPVVVLLARKQAFAATRMMMLPVFICVALIFVILFREEWNIHIQNLSSFYIFFFLFLPLFVGYGLILNGRDYLEKTDPLLFVTPLPERSIWIGYYLFSAVMMVDVCCSMELFYSIVYAMNWCSFNFVLFYPFLSLITGISCQTVVMSIRVTAKKKYQRIIVKIMLFLPLWLGFSVLTTLSHHNFSIFHSRLFPGLPRSLLSPSLLWTLFAVAVPAYFCVAWRLFDYNLARGRSFGWKLLVSCCLYLTLTAALAALWFGLWYVFQP